MECGVDRTVTAAQSVREDGGEREDPSSPEWPSGPSRWGDGTEPRHTRLLGVDAGETGRERRWAERHWSWAAWGTRGAVGARGRGQGLATVKILL